MLTLFESEVLGMRCFNQINFNCMKKLFTSLGILLCALLASAQTVTCTWDFDNPISGGKADGWTIYAYGSPNISNGVLKLTATRNAGYCHLTLAAPAGTNIVNADQSKRFLIRVKNGTKDRIANFIWTTSSGDSKMEILMSTEDADFKEYVLDLTHDQRWQGDITKLLIQLPIPINPHSDQLPIEIDYLRFTEAVSVAQLPPLVAKLPAPFGTNLSGGEFSFSGGASDWRYPRTQELDYLASKGFKLIRLPFLWERLQPTLNGALDVESLSHLKNIVWAARTRGMWVLLDLHNYNRRRTKNPDNTITDAIIGTNDAPISAIQDFWKKMAAEFKNFDNIYAHGIMNEPYSIPREIPWVNTAQAIIDAIRTEDTQNTIMVGGDSYSSASSWPAVSDNLRKLKDPSDNLMFEAHSYFDKNSAGEYSTYVLDGATAQTGVNRVTPFVEWLKKYNLRGFMGEYGIPNNPNADSDKADAVDNSLWNTLLDNTLTYLSSNGVNGTYWSYGTSWGTYKLNVYPNSNGTERPQMQVLANHLFASAPSTLPGINSALVVSYKAGKPMLYKPTATNNPTAYVVTQLPSGLSYNSTSNEITGTMPSGTHTVKIRASNGGGLGEERELVMRGVTLKIPGTLQAEEYDAGGQDVGYHDKSIGNSGNFLHRDEDVDFRRSGPTSSYIYSVTHTIPGEWLNYTTNVEQQGAYRVKFRYVTTTNDTKVNFKVDNAIVAENVELATTADLNAWTDKIFEIPTMTAGEHLFTLEVVSGTFDVDRMEFSLVTPAITPANLTAAAAGIEKVNLSWDASTNATSYKLERSESAAGTFSVIAQNLTVTSFTDETVSPGTTYFYRIKGVNVLGDGVASPNVTATTANLEIPAKVATLTTLAKNGSVELSWTEQLDINTYLIKRATTAGGPYTTIHTATSSPYTDQSVVNGTSYYYVVAAQNSLGEGENSDEKTATPSNVEYAYWSFDQIDQSTGVIDSWGNYNGTFDINASFGSNANTSHITFLEPANSYLNNAIRFRNKAASYVKLPNGLMSDVDDFTISVYYRHISNVVGGRIFDFGVGENYLSTEGNTNRKMMYLSARAGAHNGVTYAIQNGGALQTIETNVVLATGQPTVWHHIVVTKAGSTVTVYVNGQQAGQKTNMSIKPSDLGFTTANFLGKSRFSPPAVLDGAIDEFKIFTRAFTQAEVALLGPTVMPVAFLDFEAEKQKNGSVILNWSTATESNNSHFELLRSTDGKLFDPIAHLKAGTNTSAVKQYRYTDHTPKLGINYYKLKQVDLDGTASFHTKILAVASGLNNEGDLKIYANAGKLNLNVATTQASDFDLYLSDVSGKIVAKFANKVVPGSNVFEFALAQQLKGAYIATYLTKGEKKSVKLIIN